MLSARGSVSRPGFLTMEDQTVVLVRRIEFVFPASLETYQREHRKFTLSRPWWASVPIRPLI